VRERYSDHLNNCITSENKNRIRKIKNRILAIPAASAAMPVKPNIPATRATIRKSNTHLNIVISLS
jgi:hypothetical protein